MSLYFPNFTLYLVAIYPTLICIDENQGRRVTMGLSSGVTGILECLGGSSEDEVAARRSGGAQRRSPTCPT